MPLGPHSFNSHVSMLMQGFDNLIKYTRSWSLNITFADPLNAGPGLKASSHVLTVKWEHNVIPHFPQMLINVDNLCKNSDQTCFFYTLTFIRSLGSGYKPRTSSSVFNISLGTWQTLVQENPCLKLHQ